MKALLIEDEPYARQELKRLLAKLDKGIEVVAELDSVKDAIEWLEDNEDFDLIFLDIQLSDGLSFDIFRSLRIDKPVIFTTAYNEYAIQAFELNSVDYLLKPVEPALLEKAINKLDRLQQAGTRKPALDGDELRRLLGIAPKPEKSRFLIKLGDQFKTVETAEIAWFSADRNTVTLTTHDAKKYVIEYTLDELEQQLSRKDFFRAGRGIIVSYSCIKKVHKYFNSRLLLEILPEAEEQVLVSRLRVDAFLNWMDNA
ncbi:MAG: LytTR family DNA-binding domain-containing protein [Bacteroidia bacterium]|nr:LytTR family DNA-binding domain-containing protein [Bacteroidia bacterium]